MSQTKARKSKKDCLVAKVSSKISNCIFCNRSTDDEVVFGKLYDIGDISCHYFCALLSSCLVQNGDDEDGLFGFLYSDIVAEAQRGRKYKCSYCSRGGATLGCNIAQCKKQFHLPCGREHNAVSLFYGNYKTFCSKHAPRQKIADQIMVKANQRLKAENRLKRRKGTGSQEINAIEDLEEVACVICYETVPGYPSTETFWPSCCGKDAWFHRTCLQRMSLASGMHYLKCPLCNDKDDFYRAVVEQGYYVPDRDAAWELEANAFAEIYQRPAECSAAECRCSLGREHDADTGIWELKLCLLCGSSCVHGGCLPQQQSGHYVCTLCQTVEPPDLDKLAAAAVAAAPTTQDEITSRPARRGPPVPSRMSLRRTKRNCTSASVRRTTYDAVTLSYVPDSNTNSAPVAGCIENEPLKDLSNIMSPTKVIEESLKDKIMQMEIQDMSVADTRNLIEEVREKFKKPRPLSVKRMVVSHILENLLNKMPDVNAKIQDEIVTSQSDATQIPDADECKTESVQDAKKEGDIMDTEGNAPIEDEICEPPSASNVVLNDESEDKNDINNLEQDEDTKSTFELPSEFVADCNSDVSLEALDTSKRLKTLSIDNNSAIEISEKNEGVNIDVFEMHTDIDPKTDTESGNVPKYVNDSKCTLKFSLLDKEILHNSNVDIDLEVFKNQYLNEVDRRSYKCPFSHRHEEDNETAHTTIRSVIDFAIDAAVKKYHRENGYDIANDGSQRPSKPIKRKMDEENGNNEGVKVKLLENENKEWSEKTDFKVSKIGEPERSAHCNTIQNVDLKGSESRRNKIKRNKHLKKLKKSTECNEIIDLIKESNDVQRMRRKKRDKEKRRNSVRRKKLKIKLKKKAEMNGSKKNGKPSAEKENQKILKQTVLMFGSNDIILKSPIKTKTKKTKSNIKSPDNLRQMSLDNYFVLKIPI